MSRTELTKQYDELLSYLQTERRNTEQENSRSSESSSVEVKEKEETPKQSNTTDELLNNCSSDQDEVINSSDTNKGFDVKKFEELMRSKLIDEHKRSQSYTKPYISVSELTSCLRKAYYYRKKYAINIKDEYRFAYLYLFGKVGTAVHDAVQNIYDFSEVEKTLISDKYNVKGRVDAIRMDHLYELKTTDPGKVNNLTSHYNQGLIYTYILNTEYEYNINVITIVYIERNLRNIVVYDYPVDNKKAEKLLNNALILKKALDQNKTPESLMASGEQCKYCSYKQYCEKDKSDMKKPFEESDPENTEDKKVKSNAKFLLGG